MAERRLAGTQGRSPRLFIVAAVGVAVMALAGCQNYVALGDSYTAGPLIPAQETNPSGCLRSDHNYPHLASANLKNYVRYDVSCSGATTADMTNPQAVQGGTNPPQFNALASDTKAVSLTIGGNDIGFTEIFKSCATAVNVGTPCRNKYVVNGNDEISNRIAATAPKVAGVLQGIHARSPHAKIFLLAYLDILPDSGAGCFPQMPITDGDAPYLRAKEVELNGMLRTVAGNNSTVFVDTYSASIGKDACQLPTVRWVEPVVPVNPAAPVHPNAAGEQAMADLLYATMQQNGF